MSSLPGKFVWFEHQSADVPKARKFYDALFGWHTESMPMGDSRYSMILNGNEGIGGYVTDPGVERPYWLGHMSVDDVDATYRAALAAALIESLGRDVDADAEAAWSDEIARRLREVERGQVNSIPWPQAPQMITADEPHEL